MTSIFISHSTQDKDVALRVLDRLRERGYRSLFLDSDPGAGIKAGVDWERDLYRNLKMAGAVVVLCSPDSMASRWCFAEITQAKALGKALFPLVIRPCEVVGSLTDRQVIDFAARGEDESFRRLFDGLRAAGLDPADSFNWDPSRPPFPGFLYFDRDDAGIYFGRDPEVRQVIEALTRMQRQGEPRLAVIVGSSGSGKSSLVRAGVLPRLAKDPSRWAIVPPFRPMADPVGELARALATAFPDGPARPDWKVLRDRLKGEATTGPATPMLAETADDLTMALGWREASVLLVVDQAEELIQVAAAGEASAFLAALLNATGRPGGRVFALLTLRSDFLGSLQNHPAFRGVPFANMPLGLMTVESFSQVIEGPAARAEIELAPGLVHAMTADARTADALPLLAFTLREMYERCRDRSRFGLEVYQDELGGIQGSVARVVEQIKSEGDWTPETSLALRRAFLKLTRVNDEGRFTRQPARWADLPDRAAPALEAFVRARLLWSDGDTVEVAHESLFRVWPELAGWLDEGRELMLWKKGIQDEVRDWTSHDHAPDWLLSGARVAEARRWLASHADDLPGPEAEYLSASIAAEDARIARERGQQERLRRLARSLAAAFGIALILVVVAGALGWEAHRQRKVADSKANAARKAEAEAKEQQLIAEDQARTATSRQLATFSASERDRRLDRSLLLAVEALRAKNTIEARDSLYKALDDGPELSAGHLYVSGVAFSHDGKTIAAGCSGGVVLWDAATRERLNLSPFKMPNDVQVRGIAFSHDGKTIAAGCSGGVVLWDAGTGERLTGPSLDVPGGGVWGVTFSPDGRMLAAAYGIEGGLGIFDGRGVILWDASARGWQSGRRLVIAEGTATSVAFSPDGRTLAVVYTSRDGRDGVLLLDSSTWNPRGRPLEVTEGRAGGVAFDHSGHTIAVSYLSEGSGGGVMLWNAATGDKIGEPVAVLTRADGVSGVAFSPDGRTLAVAYRRFNVGGVALWDARGVEREGISARPIELAGDVIHLAFSPDGHTLAAKHEVYGRGLMLWKISVQGQRTGRHLDMPEGGVNGLAFSANGETLAAGYIKDPGHDGALMGGVVLWDAATGGRRPPRPLEVPQGAVTAVAFSPDGNMLAAAYAKREDRGRINGGGVALFNISGRVRLAGLYEVREGILRGGLAFSPDSHTLAAAYVRDGGRVMVWDTSTRKQPTELQLLVPEGTIQGLAFSTDGQMLAAGYELEKHNDGVWGGVDLWNASTWERLPRQTIEASPRVTGIAFSPDGQMLAAACDGSAVMLLDTSSPERLLERPLVVYLHRRISRVIFSPDGRTLAATHVGPGGGVRLMRGTLKSWIHQAGQIANRNFTGDEWRQYFPDKTYRPTFPNLPVPPEVTRSDEVARTARPR